MTKIRWSFHSIGIAVSKVLACAKSASGTSDQDCPTLVVVATHLKCGTKLAMLSFVEGIQLIRPV